MYNTCCVRGRRVEHEYVRLVDVSVLLRGKLVIAQYSMDESCMTNFYIESDVNEQNIYV